MLLLAFTVAPAFGQTSTLPVTLSGSSVTFNATSGSATINGNSTLSGNTTLGLFFSVDYLIVGGGGAGGSARGGGGGGGGVVQGSTSLSGTSFAVIVAAGGTGVTGSNGIIAVNGGVGLGNGTPGGSSSAFSYTAGGGGYGGGGAQTTPLGGGNGASGGGAGGNATSTAQGGAYAVARTGGSGTQGGNGGGVPGNGTNYGFAGAGGGGASGAAGGTVNAQGISAGAGGAGITGTITGSAYGGGGGGGSGTTAEYTAGLGGSGGGGAGSKLANGGTATAPGGGGGGAAGATSYRGGDGGNGLVVVRYLGGSFATGGSVSTGFNGSFTDYTYHTFASTGSTNFVANIPGRLLATVTGTLDGSGNLDVNTQGVVALSAASTFTGTTTVSSGTLRLDVGNAIAQSTFAGGSGSLAFASSVTNVTLGGLVGSSTVALTNQGNAGVRLTVGGASTFDGVLAGLGGLDQQNGFLRLNGVNTYSGETLIGTSGTLTIGSGGSIGSSGTITVGGPAATNARLDLSVLGTGTYVFNAGQTLRGGGTIYGVTDGSSLTRVTINGLLSPGNSPGTLEFDTVDVALGPQSNTLMEITGTTPGTQHDVVSLNLGTLTYGGTMELNFSQTFASGTFNLFEFAGSNGSFDRIVATGAYSGTFTNTGSGVYSLSGSQTLTFTQQVIGGGLGQLVIVPEPLTLGLLGIGASVASLGFRHRLRRRRSRTA